MTFPVSFARSCAFQSIRKCSLFLSVAFLLAACFCAPAGTEYTWTNEAGGDFWTAGNWDPNAVPGTNDIAIFNVTAGPYTVTWSANATNHSLRVPEGTVTFDLGGYLYGLNRFSTNSVGTETTTADLTITNGTVQRLNHGYLASFNYSFRLKGTDTTLRLLADGEYLYAYYAFFGDDTHIIIDGPGARFSTGGFYTRECDGSIVVTNGGFLDGAGTFPNIGAGAEIRISGPGNVANLGPRDLNSGALILLHNDAAVKGYGGHTAPSLIEGDLTLDDARFYYYNTTVGGLRIVGPDGVLQGDGEVEYKLIEIEGGAIRPGGTNNAGLLACKGDFTNSTGTGSIEIELGGTGAGQFDRLTFAATPGSGILYAGGDLDISLINSFSPSDGDTFDILDFAGATGTFDNVNLPGNTWDWATSNLYTTGEIAFWTLSEMPIPTNVAASDGSFTDKVQVVWNTTDPATGYEVWRNLSNNNATATQIGGASGTAYDDPTVTPGLTYWYWVKATNATLTSDFSDPDDGYAVAALPVPAVPANVSASDGIYMYQGRVEVTWDTSADAVGYRVWRNASNESSTATRIGTAPTNTYDDTAVPPNQTNVYWVVATNAAHESAFSSPDTGWMAPAPPFEIVWTNEAGGDFQTPGNWTPNFMPVTSNRAVFGALSGPYTVTWSSSASNAAFRVDDGTITWNLQGNTYDLDVLQAASSIGTDLTTVDLTWTNGTVRSTGVNAGNKIRIRGTNTTLRIFEAQALGMPYPHIYGPARVIARGPSAAFTSAGYAYFYGETIITNGAYMSFGAGTRMYDGGAIWIRGGNSTHSIAPSYFEPGATIFMGGGAVVNEAYIGNNPRRTPIEGRFIVDDATYTGAYGDSFFGLIGANAVLEGEGLMRFVRVENLLGTIIPGGTNSAGLLITEGVSNAASGTISMELGGTETNQYDRLFAVDGLRGDGDFWAGGTLEVALIDDFYPQADTFDLFGFVSMQGAFAALDLPALPGDWDTNNLYVTGEISYLPPPSGTVILIQ